MWADTPDVVLSAWLLFKLKPHVSFSLSLVGLPFLNLLVMKAKTESRIVMRKAAGWASLLPTVPRAKTSLLDKLSGLKHGSLLFTHRDIFHLKQIFAQKRIVLGLNGLSDINGPVSDSGQRSHPQSERSPCSVPRDTKREKVFETSLGCLTFLV